MNLLFRCLPPVPSAFGAIVALMLVAACDTSSSLVPPVPELASVTTDPAAPNDLTPACEDLKNVGLGASAGLPWDFLSIGIMTFEDDQNECKLRLSLKSAPTVDLTESIYQAINAGSVSFTVQGAQEISEGLQVDANAGVITGQLGTQQLQFDASCLAEKLGTLGAQTLTPEPVDPSVFAECLATPVSLPPTLSAEVTVAELAAEFPLDGTPLEVLAQNCQVVDPVCRNIARDDVLEVTCGGEPTKSVYANDMLYFNNWPSYTIEDSPLLYNDDPTMPDFMPSVVSYDRATGQFSAPPAGDGNDALRAEAEGTTFTPSYRLWLRETDQASPLEQINEAAVTLKYTCPEVRPFQNAQVVLDWGQEPRDLDTHLYTPSIEGASYHVYYANSGSETSAPYAKLQNDDTSSFGPETLNLTKSFSGTYTYAVHKYAGSGEITDSGATVKLTLNSGETQTWSIPKTGSGDWWTVFRLDGDTGAITTINTIGTAASKSATGLAFGTTTMPEKDIVR